MQHGNVETWPHWARLSLSATEVVFTGTLTTMQRGLQSWQRETGDTWPEVVRPSPQDQALRLAGGSL